MRAGATDRLGMFAGTMTSVSLTSLSTNTSYMLFSAARTSMYDIELLPCGSRSISSVGLPRMARAAARLIAVVVLPTPPFWFAMARIICTWEELGRIVTGKAEELDGLGNQVIWELIG